MGKAIGSQTRPARLTAAVSGLGQCCNRALRKDVAPALARVGAAPAATLCSLRHFARIGHHFFHDLPPPCTAAAWVLRAGYPPKQHSAAAVGALRFIADSHCPAAAAAVRAMPDSAPKARLRTARKRSLFRTPAEAIQRAAASKLF